MNMENTILKPQLKLLSPVLKDLMVHLYQSENVRLFSAKFVKNLYPKKKKILYVVWLSMTYFRMCTTSRLSVNWYQRLDYSQWLIETSEGLTEKTNYHLHLWSHWTMHATIILQIHTWDIFMRKDKFDIKAAVCLKSLTIYCKYTVAACKYENTFIHINWADVACG